MAEEGTIHSLLLRYSLANVEPVLNDEGAQVVISQGSYGRILKVLVSGSLCAAKEIHFSIAMGPGNVYVQQFTREIDLMSQMRHPNVVQFLGVHLPERPDAMSPVRELNLPWLVMEYLPFELHSTLEKARERKVEIPFSVKVSFMLDIARGLSYMHRNRSSEIIHRDLSARNVLLTSSLSAKLADFGVSKRHVYNTTMTMNVGNPWFMPPENKPGSGIRYNSQMDLFSFGVIVLFIISETFPGDLEAESFTDKYGDLIARSEVERRQKYIDIAEGYNHPNTPLLLALCKECLANQPHKRPNAEGVLDRLNHLDIPNEVTVMEKLQFLTKMRQPIRQQQANDCQEVSALQTQLGQLRTQLEGRNREVVRIEGTLSQLRIQAQRATEQERQAAENQRELEVSRSLCERLRSELAFKAEQLVDKQRAFDREKEMAENYERIINLTGASENELQQTRVELLKVKQNRDEWRVAHTGVVDQLRATEMELAQLRQESTKLNEDLKRREECAKKKAMSYKDQLQQLESSRQESPASLPPLPPSGLQTSLRLSCSRQQYPAPHGLYSAHCVHYDNKILYGGGIHAAQANHLKSILAFDLDSNKWSVFSAHLKLMNFSLVVVSGQLLMVGGYDDTCNQYTDKISEFVEGEGWKEMAERLPTKKAKAAVLAYRNWLIVAGGCTSGAHSLDQVHAIQLGLGGGWKTLASLPEHCQDFQCASYVSLHKTDPSKDLAVWYLTSYVTGLSKKQPVMGVSIPDLLTKGGKWTRLPEPPVRSPAVTTLHGHLLTLGGHDAKRQSLISNKVYMYHHGTKEWLCVAEVSNNYTPRMSSTCVSMSSGHDTARFMILGGKDKVNNYSTTVEVFNQLPNTSYSA